MNFEQRIEKRIDELVEEIVQVAREAVMAKVSSAFVPGAARPGRSGSESRRARVPRGVRKLALGKKRPPEEIEALVEKLLRAISERPGETMITYSQMVDSKAKALGVPVRRLIATHRVRSVGDRNRRRYFPAVT